MKVGYARVSTHEQSLDLQLDALRAFGCEEIYQEKMSGAKAERVELEHALKSLRAGDQFVVYKIDRLARSTKQLIEISELLREKGVEFVSLKDNIDTSTANGKMMFGMLAVIAEFERDMIRERTLSGLQSARGRGRVGGRPGAKKEKIEMALKMYQSGQYTFEEIREATGVAKSTIYKYLKTMQTTHE